MPTVYLIGKLAENPRGKRLQHSVKAVCVSEWPTEAGLVLGSGQDYQTRTPHEQRQWLAWAARPGCTCLLVPPFQTGACHEPGSWELASLEKKITLEPDASPVLRLTLPEINVWLNRGLSRTMHPVIDAGSDVPLSGLFRKHPSSGIFAVTAVPVWSVALVDCVPALNEWLSAWLSLTGSTVKSDTSDLVVGTFEPTQRHYSALLYLASDNFPDRVAALTALAWNETFQFGDEDISTLLDALEHAGLIVGGALTEAGRRSLLDSPYRPYVEALLNQKLYR